MPLFTMQLYVYKPLMPTFLIQMDQVPVALLVCPSQEFLSGTFYHHSIHSIQIIVSIVAMYVYLALYM